MGKKRRLRKQDKKAARTRKLAARLLQSRLENRDQLEQAMRDAVFVRLDSTHRHTEPVEGYVVALGRRWAALALLDAATRPDGWALVRLRDVARVEPRAHSALSQQILRARSAWPLTAPEGLPLDKGRELTDALVARGELMAVHVEGFDPDARWVGMPVSHREGELELHEITARGRWLRRPTFFDVKAVTRFTLGDGRTGALALVAGERPELAPTPPTLTAARESTSEE